MDMILYLPLYYLVNDLIHLPNPTIRGSNINLYVYYARGMLATLTF